MCIQYVFKSNNYYYLQYERTIEVMDFSMRKNITKLKLINISKIFCSDNLTFFLDTSGKIFVFDEIKLTLSLFLDSNMELCYFAAFNKKFNSIILIGTIKSFMTSILKINLESKHIERFDFKGKKIIDIYSYKNSNVELLSKVGEEFINFDILSISLDDFSLTKTKTIYLDGSYNYGNERYLYGHSYQNEEFFYDKFQNKFLNIKQFNLDIYPILDFFDYKDYFYICGCFVSYLTDNKFNIIKKFDAKSSKKPYSVVPNIYIDSDHVIYQMTYDIYRAASKEDFFNKKLIDCEV